MVQDIIRVIEQISKEKGINKQVLIDAVEDAFVSAAKKTHKYGDNLTAHLNEDIGQIELFQVKKVVPIV